VEDAIAARQPSRAAEQSEAAVRQQSKGKSKSKNKHSGVTTATACC